MGIDVAPRFDAFPHVFVAAPVGRGNRTVARATNVIRRLFGRHTVHAVTTRIIRLTDAGDRGIDTVAVAEGIPAGPIHAGGALRFGPDGRLWFGTGDAGVPSLAGDPSSRAGKILALAPGESETIAQGLRNPQGLEWNPRDGSLWATDHGPTGLLREGRRTGMDELNVIAHGADYGWPIESGRAEPPVYRPPLVVWRDAIAPAGLAFWNDDVFVSALAGRDLFRIGLDDKGAPACTGRMFDGRYGRMRALRLGPDGALWVGTSNRDGRGTPRDGDDLLLRIVPAQDD